MLRVALVLVSTAAYFGLAVLGGGGLAAFFSHPARVALAIAGFLLAGASLFTAGNLSSGVREDRGNRWVLVAFALIGLLDAYLPAYADRADFWTFDDDAIRWLGVVLFAAGGALGPGLSIGARRTAHRAPDPAAAGAHPCRRAAATSPVRWRIRRLLRPHGAADSRPLLAIRVPRARPSGRTLPLLVLLALPYIETGQLQTERPRYRQVMALRMGEQRTSLSLWPLQLVAMGKLDRASSVLENRSECRRQCRMG
jgi:hypothetical protein